MNHIQVRKYQANDTKALVDIYYNTIHKINCRHYTEVQLNAWASELHRVTEKWEAKWLNLFPFVAVHNSQPIGFVEFEDNGHIDCFYCHHDWIRKGVGSKLMEAVLSEAERKTINRVYAEVSITAKPFFLRHSFNVIKDQTILLSGVELNNFVMEKYLNNT